MKRNTKDLFFELKKDVTSISVMIALLGALLGGFTIWRHAYTVENDIDYRELLSVVIGVLTTIVVTTYSLTIVALQLASVQFSPRILRSFFTEDRFNQVVLGTFVGEITYLLLLKTWSPKCLDLPICVGLFVAAFLICVVFPLFITHIVDSINAGSIIRRVAFHLLDEIDEHYGKTPACSADFELSQHKKRPTQNLVHITSNCNGYIQNIDYQLFNNIFEFIKKEAQRNHITLTEMYQKVSVGEFVAEGIPLFILENENLSTSDLNTFEKALLGNVDFQNMLNRCIKVGKYRSYHQDIHFGIRQLVDIAIKAISPAVNDPTTCINSLDYLGMVLRRLAQCPPKCLQYHSLPTHIHAKEFGFREYLDHAFDQIYHFGQTDFIVVCRIIRTLRSVVEVTEHSAHLEILNIEYQDIKSDVLKLEDTFTAEGFMKIKKELEGFEAVIQKKI
jgi:uncharacterized membrane protein